MFFFNKKACATMAIKNGSFSSIFEIC